MAITERHTLPKVGNIKSIFLFSPLRTPNFYDIVATFGGSELVEGKAGMSASVTSLPNGLYGCIHPRVQERWGGEIDSAK